jgi:hypothetical protein
MKNGKQNKILDNFYQEEVETNRVKFFNIEEGRYG